MTRNLFVALRLLSLFVVALIGSRARGQDVLVPKWSMPGDVGGVVEYSPDGTKLVVGGGGMSVYSGDGKQLLIHEALYGSSFVFSRDGSKIYYRAQGATQAAVYEYDLASRASTVLLDDTYANRELQLSKNGRWMACLGSGNSIAIVDLQARTLHSRFFVTDAVTFQFIDNDQKLVVNGPRVYDLDGGFLGGDTTNVYGQLLATPDETKFAFETNGLTRVYRSSDLSIIWSLNLHANLHQVSRDGKSLFLTPQQGRIVSVDFATGNVRPLSVVSPTSHAGDNYHIAVCPDKDILAMGSSEGGVIETFTYNSETGGGDYIETMFSGLCYRIVSAANWRVGAAYVPSIMTIDTDYIDFHGELTNKYISVRKAATGEIVFKKPLPSAERPYSPDRKYYFIQSGPLTVYDSSTGKAVSTFSQAAGIKWSGPTTILAYVLASNRYQLGVFVESGGVFIRKGKNIPIEDKPEVSRDGRRIAMLNSSSGLLDIYNVQDGTLITSISPLIPNSAVSSFTFSDNGLLAVQDISTTEDNSLRIYDTSGATVTLVRTITEHLAGLRYASGTISPSGRFACLITEAFAGNQERAIGSIKVYQVSDGRLVRNWENQFLPQVNRSQPLSLPSICFSSDDFLLTWQTYSHMLITAVVPSVLSSLTIDPTSVSGGTNATATVTLNRVVSQDTVIKVSSTSDALTLPATVTVRAGKSSQTFAVETKSVAVPVTAPVSCSLTGGTLTATVKVSPVVWVDSLVGSATDLSGNTTLGVTIQLSGPAPSKYSLPTSSNAAAIVVPASISVPSGHSTLTVSLPVKKVSADKTVTITIGGKTLQVHLHPPTAAVTAVTSNKTDVTGNDTIELTIHLDMPAPAGFTVAGASSAAAITVPASITIPTGQTSYVLTLAVKKVTVDRTATITIGGKTVTIILHAS